jgi:hypothetical protein
MNKKETKCPCGQIMEVPLLEDDTYDVINLICPKCRRRSMGGNCRSGYVDSWMTSKNFHAAKAEMQAMQFDADNNDFYGRGNW